MVYASWLLHVSKMLQIQNIGGVCVCVWEREREREREGERGRERGRVVKIRLRQLLEDHCATWLVHICGAWVFHVCDTWRQNALGANSKTTRRHDSSIHVGHDSLHMCVLAAATRKPLCDMTRFLYVGYDSLHMCVLAAATRRTVCDMTHSYMWGMTHYIRVWSR